MPNIIILLGFLEKSQQKEEVWKKASKKKRFGKKPLAFRNPNTKKYRKIKSFND